MLTDALNEMKRKSGKTLSQIGEECNIPKGTLNKVFAGQTRDPQYGTLRTIVHALGYTLDDLETFPTMISRFSVTLSDCSNGGSAIILSAL